MSTPSSDNPPKTINIVPEAETIMNLIDRLIADCDYFAAVNIALTFEGPDVLEYARNVADRCVAHRSEHRADPS